MSTLKKKSFPAAGHSLTPTLTQLVAIFPDILATLSMIEEEQIKEIRTSPDEQLPVNEVDVQEVEVHVLPKSLFGSIFIEERKKTLYLAVFSSLLLHARYLC